MKNAALNLDQLEGTMLHDPHNSHLFIYPNFFGIRDAFKNVLAEFVR